SGPVYNNDLGGNTGFAIDNNSATTIDASMNYLGSNTGAGAAAEIDGPVDYTPFLDSNTDTAPATPGFQGNFNSLHAAAAGAQTGSTGRIQEAVDRSTGTNPIIVVEAGTYTEHVNVNKTVQLRGAQFGVDARDATRTGLTPTAAESIVNGPGGSFSLNANGTQLDGFTVQGTTTGLPIGAGIFVPAGFSGHGIRNNIVQDNIIGVYLNGNGATQTVFERNVVRDNDNPGPAGGTGVYSDQGLSNALIQNNRVTGANPTAGINLAGTQAMITITNNEFLTGNQLVLFSTDGSAVSTNTFSGLLPGGGGGTAVFIGGGSDLLTVTGNTITGRAGGAISASDFGPGPNSNLTITNNTVTQDTSLFTVNRSMISLNGVSGTSSVAGNTVTLSGTITPTTNFVHGIDIQGAATGTINVTSNTLNGGNADTPDGTSDSSGIRLRSTASGGVITLTTNTVSGFVDGVKADQIPLTITGGSYSNNEDDGLEFANGFLTLTISGVTVTGNAGDGLLVTNPAPGGTFNLSDLTLTGNGAGGQITNVSTFVFSPSTATNADTVAFTATQFQHTRDAVAQQAVLYTNINALTVNGGGGNDSVTHSAIGNHPGGLNINGGAGTADSFLVDDTGRTTLTTYDINPTTVTRTGGPGPVINVAYSGLEGLTVNAGNGSETFNVTASPTTAITVDGNAAGDTLNYDAEGRPTTRTPPTGPDGTITSPGVQPVTFFDIESVNISSTLESISISDAVVAEPATGSRNAIFTVKLSSPVAGPVTVDFTTSDGTATAGSDYASTSGTLTFAAGQTVQTISVPVLADGPGEPDETFTVTLSNPTNAVISDGTATGTITESAQTAGLVIISELRLSGPLGPNDEFVELYNNTNSPITVTSTDGSSGWGLYKSGASCDATPLLVAAIPNGTVIPARGHYLLVGTSYSLANYGGTGAASGDQPFLLPIADDSNLGLFSTSNVQNLASGSRLDAVGFLPAGTPGNNCDLLSEGSPLQPAGGSTSEYSFVRNLAAGTPRDRADNATDFNVVSTTPTVAVGSNAAPTLGAPGPENDGSPVQRNASVKGTPIDPCVGIGTAPNRVRDTTPDPNPANNSAAGTLKIRRKFTNGTGGPLTRLRFRIVDITTYPPAPGNADLRARSSSPSSVTVSVNCGGGTVPLTGLTLEEPPAQPNGGGLNSTLSAGTITLGTALGNGNSINVEFLLGVMQPGNFRFLVNVEASPGGPPFRPTPNRGVTEKGADNKGSQP
ncbi:MAG: right-handed parallel beta-helix repeat-containing protein, partial [Acidobacteria bacterium]|nr:right-handed parallel beta-helix repeat-containing protein [Acidobacteriota bacterium]